MELAGKIWKNRQHWLVEVPSLDVMTQGKTKQEALLMMRDAVWELIHAYFKTQMKKDFDVMINDYKKGMIGISATDNKLLLALSLRRQREQSGLTVREVAKSLGSKSPNAYAQYERGKTRISLDQYEKLLQAANPSKRRQLRVM